MASSVKARGDPRPRRPAPFVTTDELDHDQDQEDHEADDGRLPPTTNWPNDSTR